MNQASPARKNGFSIGATCPGCAGELELESNFFVLTCRHCGSVLRIIMPDAPPAYLVRPRKSGQEIRFLVDRHCREQGCEAPSGTSPIQLLYYPYWKIDAVTLKVRSTQYEVDLASEENAEDSLTEERELTTINLAPFMTTLPAACVYAGIPASLGVRADYVRMTPFIDGSVAAEAICLPVTQSATSAAALAEKVIANLGRIDQAGSLRHETRLFHPTGSIIYFPYYVIDSYRAGDCIRYIVDGLAGRIAGTEKLDVVPAVDPQPQPMQFGALQLVPHRCSNCGVDLPATRAVVYQCHNCRHVEFFESHPRLEQSLFSLTDHERREDRLFPFWQLTVASETCSRDFFGGTRASNQLMIPAFDMRNLESTYRLAKRMTTAAQQLAVYPLDQIEKEPSAVSRSLADSLTLLEVLWYREMAARDVRQGNAYEPPNVSNIRLVFAPFHPEQYFYVDSILNAVTFEKAGALTAIH